MPPAWSPEVPTVLYTTAVATLLQTSFGPSMSVSHKVFSGGHTQHHPLSVPAAKSGVGYAHGGPKRRLMTCAHSSSTEPFRICNTRVLIANVPYTHANEPGTRSAPVSERDPAHPAPLCTRFRYGFRIRVKKSFRN